MLSACTPTKTSYATWKVHTLSRVCANLIEDGPRLSFLRPYRTRPRCCNKRHFHQSSVQFRSNIKDVKRSAKYRAVQLELRKHIKSDVESNGESRDHAGQVSYQPSKNDGSKWNPFVDGSLEDLQKLLADLHVMTKEANQKDGEEENVPFEHGSQIFARSKRGEPASPLERQLPWAREKKLQVHEVQVDKRLEDNVWAQMLASPMRLDRGSKARLPRSLMTTWGVVQNPTDGKDFMLPVELSDLEAFEQQLQKTGSKSEESATTVSTREGTNSVQIHSTAGMRINIAPNQLLLKAMSKEFLQERPGRKATSQTNSGKVKGSLIPYRWRHRQAELEAFHKTRQKFNEVLQRHAEADEPNFQSMAKLDKLQWQPDIAARLAKIMRERILIALEAVGRDNASSIAVRQKRILAVSMPETGELSFGKPKDSASDVQEGVAVDDEQFEVLQDDEQPTLPGWVSGAIGLYIGEPAYFYDTVEKQDPVGMERLPAHDLIPPLLTINQQCRVPIFSLEAMLGSEYGAPVDQILRANKVLTLDFWLPVMEGTSASQFGQNVHDDAKHYANAFLNGNADEEPQMRTPKSSVDVGEQVLSSIVTPNAGTEVLSDNQLDHSISSQPTVEQTQDSGHQQPYILLIKPRAQHANVLISEIWQLWRYIGGRACVPSREHVDQVN